MTSDRMHPQPPTTHFDPWLQLARGIFAARPASFQINCMDTGGPQLQSFKRAAHSAGYRFNVIPDTIPALAVGDSWEGFRARLGHALQIRLTVAEQEVSKLGLLSLHVERDLSPLLLDALQLHDTDWFGKRAAHSLGFGAQPAITADIARLTARLGWLRAFLLLLNGEPVAWCIALHHAEDVDLLRASCQPHHQLIGAPLLLLQSMLEYCFRHGVKQVGFHTDARQDTTGWSTDMVRCARFEAFDASLASTLRWASERFALTMCRHALAATPTRAKRSDHLLQ